MPYPKEWEKKMEGGKRKPSLGPFLAILGKPSPKFEGARGKPREARKGSLGQGPCHRAREGGRNKWEGRGLLRPFMALDMQGGPSQSKSNAIMGEREGGLENNYPRA